METDACRDDDCHRSRMPQNLLELTEVSLRTAIWTHCSPPGATTPWRRALQASYHYHDDLPVQESKDRCYVASFYTVPSGKSSSE